LQLGNIYLDVNELRGRSLAWADNLAIRTGEAVRVGTLHDDGVLIIHHVFRPDNTLQILESERTCRCTRPRSARPFWRTTRSSQCRCSHGRCALTKATLVTRAGVERALDAVRTNAYAVEREEAIIGEASIAAPIFDRRNEPAGAIGIAGRRTAVREARAPARPHRAGARAARAITRDLGGARF